MPPQTKIDKCTERCDLVDLLNEYRRERVQPPPCTPESQVRADAPAVSTPGAGAPAPTPAPVQEPRQQETQGQGGELSGGGGHEEVCWGKGFSL